MAAHTKEPWSQVGTKIYSSGMPGRDGRVLAIFTRHEDAAKAQSSVNACAGIENPAATPEAVKALEYIDYAVNITEDKLETCDDGEDLLICITAKAAKDLRKALAALKTKPEHADALNGRR